MWSRSPRAPGAQCCWRSQSTASGPSFLFFATPELRFEQGWIWISPWFSGCWLILLSATRHALQSHPYLMFVSGWFQTRDLWLHLLVLTISNADCFSGSFKPVCNRVRNVLPGALLQLPHDETVLELFSVIMIGVLVWKYFWAGKLKAREYVLERIISCWCSLSKCGSCLQEK